MTHALCKDCRNFKHSVADVPLGFCHRYPPVLIGNLKDEYGQWVAEWPRVAEDDWCGEFAPGKNPFAVE